MRRRRSLGVRRSRRLRLHAMERGRALRGTAGVILRHSWVVAYLRRGGELHGRRRVSVRLPRCRLPELPFVRSVRGRDLRNSAECLLRVERHVQRRLLQLSARRRRQLRRQQRVHGRRPMQRGTLRGNTAFMYDATPVGVRRLRSPHVRGHGRLLGRRVLLRVERHAVRVGLLGRELQPRSLCRRDVREPARSGLRRIIASDLRRERHVLRWRLQLSVQRQPVRVGLLGRRVRSGSLHRRDVREPAATGVRGLFAAHVRSDGLMLRRSVLVPLDRERLPVRLLRRRVRSRPVHRRDVRDPAAADVRGLVAPDLRVERLVHRRELLVRLE